MKKRNFNILISFVLITVVAYFIYALVICQKPSYELKDVRGDRQAIGDLVITGKALVSKHSYIKSTIDKDNVKIEEGSFDPNRGMDYTDIEYKDFYLGKNIDDFRKAESKDYLLFGEVNSYKAENNNVLDIRIMNKKSKDLKDIKLPLERNTNGFTNKVYILDTMGIITINLQDEKNGKHSTKIYSFNLETGEKINEFSFDKYTQKNRFDNKIEDDYIILLAASKYDYEEKKSKEPNELFLYDIKENKLRTIDLKDIDTNHLSIIGNSKDLYLLNEENKLYKVDIEKNLVKEVGNIPLSNGNWISSAIISKDRIYMATQEVYDKGRINVYDINDMKELYEGEIETKSGVIRTSRLELNLLK